jgi:uncharacterized protein YacL
MNRTTTLRLIAVALAGCGVYAASDVLPMLVGPPMPVLLVAYLRALLIGVVALIVALAVARYLNSQRPRVRD